MEGRGRPWFWLRVALVIFVLAWILGPSELRGTFPILLVFGIAVGLELHFLISALRGGPARSPDRTPQQVDRDRYGFDWDEDDEPLEDGDEEEEEEEDEAWLEAAPRPHPLRRFAVGLAVIAALVIAMLAVDRNSGWGSLSGERKAAAVARFSDEASRIADKPVVIRCDEARDYVGAVQHADGVSLVGGDLAILTPEICNDLYRLAFEGETTGSRTGRAIAVLAHEAWHLRGESDESVTECYALQSGVALGRRLGLSDDRARQLMRQQLVENALRGAGTLEYRLTSECRNNGTLDLDSAGDRFP